LEKAGDIPDIITIKTHVEPAVRLAGIGDLIEPFRRDKRKNGKDAANEEEWTHERIEPPREMAPARCGDKGSQVVKCITKEAS
jgi:hypothetical protein